MGSLDSPSGPSYQLRQLLAVIQRLMEEDGDEEQLALLVDALWGKCSLVQVRSCRSRSKMLSGKSCQICGFLGGS